MADNTNATCIICGKRYRMCLSCRDYARTHPWQIYTDNAEHYVIHQIIKGQRRVTADTDLRLTTYFGLSQGYFLRYQEDYELRIARHEIADDISRIKPIKAMI